MEKQETKNIHIRPALIVPPWFLRLFSRWAVVQDLYIPTYLNSKSPWYTREYLGMPRLKNRVLFGEPWYQALGWWARPWRMFPMRFRKRLYVWMSSDGRFIDERDILDEALTAFDKRAQARRLAADERRIKFEEYDQARNSKYKYRR